MASNLPPKALTSSGAPRHEPTAFMVLMEPMPGGGYRVSTPHARGWAATARTPVELGRAMALAQQETVIAAYARAQGKVYDLDQMTLRVPGDPLASRPSARERGTPARRRTLSAADWQMTDDGRWRSPRSGRTYGAESPVARRVVAKRKELGLPT